MEKFISYSQHADDYIAWQLLGKKSKGTVVEVGAFDGVHLSNSYSLEQLGWQSICIEPNPLIYKYLEKNRPNAININKAIVGDEKIEVIDFYSEEIGVLSGCNYDEKDIKKRYQNRGLEYKAPVKITVEATTLTSLLNCINIKNKVIDIISIDVEGFELEVLKGIDLNKYNVKLFIIEANNILEKKTILNFFSAFTNYVHIGNNYQNLFIARKDAIRKKWLRNLEFIDYFKAEQVHPVNNKFSLDSIAPNFIKTAKCKKMEKFISVF